MVPLDILRVRLTICTAIIALFLGTAQSCVPNCLCITLKPKKGENDDSPRRKVDCSDRSPPFTTISVLDRIPLDTVHLDLSHNEIDIIKRGAFSRLSSLQKLDLSHNHIGLIEPDAFESLPNLERLDLSNNRIGSVSSSMFTGLPKLQKLSLSSNRINTIPEGTFNDLPALKKVEFNSDYLRCDCHLQWIVKWSKNKSVKIDPKTTCAIPSELKGSALKGLKKKDLHCERPLELPIFEIIPGTSQIVFEGDKLPFMCRASVIDPKTEMVWIRRGNVLEDNRSSGILVHTTKVPDGSVMEHRLVLENLLESHSGIWTCMVITPQGNVSNAINVIVIPSNAKYCSLISVRTNKGVYTWAKTVAGIVLTQDCKVGKNKKAMHECSSEGSWENLDVRSCDFTREATRKLQILAEKVVNLTRINGVARELTSLLTKAETIQESADVIFAAEAISKLSDYVGHGEEVTDAVLSSVSAIMDVEKSILIKAQLEKRACTEIVKAVENIPKNLGSGPKLTKTNENIAMQVMTIPARSYEGVTCMVYILALTRVFMYSDKAFECQKTLLNQTSLLRTKDGRVQASIQLPRSVVSVDNVTAVTVPDEDKKNISLQFIVYRESTLFPITSNNHDDPLLGTNTWKVVSNVISGSIGKPVTNLSEPVILTFEVPDITKELAAAYWDFDANGGLGDWRTDGCEIIDLVFGNVTIVHCYHLSIFSVLESQTVKKNTMFHLMEAVIYVGSCLCILCMMAVIITYVSCFRFINVPKKMKHSVINICLSVVLLIIAFAMGVKRTDHHRACQIVGIAIHYLTLCAIFWITITANNMLKKFTKAERPPAPPPEPLPMPLPPKPMLRFYLLGYGVPVIICGITAAVNIDHYAEPEYCFLSWDPSLGAFYGPVGLLVILNLAFFMRISCVIRGSSNTLNETDETTELHVNEIELTPNVDDMRIETRSNYSNDSSASVASSILDQERRPITQLRALVAMLFLYILVWVCGALAVATPFKSIMPQQELIFSYLYGLSSAFLGIFMLVYYCLSRKDSRSSWERFFFCSQQNIYDMNRSNGPQYMAHANGHAVGAGSEADLSNKNINITQTNHVKNGPQKQSNLNLVPSHTASITEGSVSSTQETFPNFVNPKQNGVAKKFWDKTKNRHNSKLLNKDIARHIAGGGVYPENLSGSESQRRHSQGYSSDANTHLSIEIQIQANPADSDHHSNQSPQLGMVSQDTTRANHIPFNIQDNLPLTTFSPLIRNEISPAGGITSPDCSVVSYNSGSQNLPQHIRSPSSCSLGSRTHQSAFTPVQPRNNTLPRQSKAGTPSSPTNPPKEFMMRNGSVPRVRDFDGQSQVSDVNSHEKQQSPSPSDAHLPGYGMPEPMKKLTGPYTIKQYGPIDRGPSFDSFGGRARTSSGGFSSDGSSKIARNRDNNFVKEVEQRIPPNSLDPNSSHASIRSKSPVTSDNQSAYDSRVIMPDSDSQIHYRKHRLNDSDHNSEPTSQAHRKRHHRSHNHRHSKHKGITKQRSLDWEDQFKDQPKRQIPYAYVNHSYQEKVIQRLTSKALGENVDPKSKAFWVPRSSSNYDQVAQEEYKRMVEDSSSSSDDDDSLDNVWVLQEEDEREKFKKETSV